MHIKAPSKLKCKEQQKSHPEFSITLLCAYSKKQPVSFQKQAVFGGDKRDRTADLLNAMEII